MDRVGERRWEKRNVGYSLGRREFLRVPRRLSRRYCERDTYDRSTIVEYLAFRKLRLKKDKLCDLMTNNSWRLITNLGFILPDTTSFGAGRA